jgi:hypothetical protein
MSRSICFATFWWFFEFKHAEPVCFPPIFASTYGQQPQNDTGTPATYGQQPQNDTGTPATYDQQPRLYRYIHRFHAPSTIRTTEILLLWEIPNPTFWLSCLIAIECRHPLHPVPRRIIPDILQAYFKGFPQVSRKENEYSAVKYTTK